MVKICDSEFALGVCAWARGKGRTDFCAIADNDPLDGIRTDYESGLRTLEETSRNLKAKIEQFENDGKCVMASQWLLLYKNYMDELGTRRL